MVVIQQDESSNKQQTNQPTSSKEQQTSSSSKQPPCNLTQAVEPAKEITNINNIVHFDGVLNLQGATIIIAPGFTPMKAPYEPIKKMNQKILF